MIPCSESLQRAGRDSNNGTAGFCGNGRLLPVDQGLFIVAEAACVVLTALDREGIVRAAAPGPGSASTVGDGVRTRVDVERTFDVYNVIVIVHFFVLAVADFGGGRRKRVRSDLLSFPVSLRRHYRQYLRAPGTLRYMCSR